MRASAAASGSESAAVQGTCAAVGPAPAATMATRSEAQRTVREIVRAALKTAKVFPVACSGIAKSRKLKLGAQR